MNHLSLSWLISCGFKLHGQTALSVSHFPLQFLPFATGLCNKLYNWPAFTPHLQMSDHPVAHTRHLGGLNLPFWVYPLFFNSVMCTWPHLCSEAVKHFLCIYAQKKKISLIMSTGWWLFFSNKLKGKKSFPLFLGVRQQWK